MYDGPVPESHAQVQAALGALGVRPRKGLGQSFLTDPFVADAEAALLAPSPDESLVEIGGGLGILTKALLRRGVVGLRVVERDHRLALHLRRTFGDRVRVEETDALEADWSGSDGVIGNLPFSVATPIVLRLLRARRPRGVFLLQQEVADRLAAGPGSRSYGRLSIFASLYGRVEAHQLVPRDSFEPIPKVAGRLVTFVPRSGPLPVQSGERLETVVRTLFSARRKQLKNLLPRISPTGEDPEAIARAAGWDPDWATKRPEELAPDAYFALVRTLETTPGGSRHRPTP